MHSNDRDYEYAEAIKAIRLPPEPQSRAPLVLTAIQIAAVLIFVACVFAIAGTFDLADEIDREADIKVLRAERAAKLSMPIEAEVTVTQSLPSGREATTRFYTRTSQKEGK
jgi:hypothetical protein